MPLVLHTHAGAAFGEHTAPVAGLTSDAFTSGVEAAMGTAGICLMVGWIGSLLVNRAAQQKTPFRRAHPEQTTKGVARTPPG